MQTIAELPEFIRKSDKLLLESQKDDIIKHLSINPKSGDLIQGTGGIRKLIPFSRSNDMNIVPIIVLPMFIKNLSHSHSSNGDFL